MNHPLWHLTASNRRHTRRDQKVLVGVRSICAYVRIGAATFYRWHQAEEFPAMRTPDGRWCTSTGLIDGWIVTRWRAQQGESRQGQGCSLQDGGGDE